MTGSRTSDALTRRSGTTNAEDATSLTQLLRWLVSSRQLSAGELAHEMGIGLDSAYRILNHDVCPRADAVRRLMRSKRLSRTARQQLAGWFIQGEEYGPPLEPAGVTIIEQSMRVCTPTGVYDVTIDELNHCITVRCERTDGIQHVVRFQNQPDLSTQTAMKLISMMEGLGRVSAKTRKMNVEPSATKRSTIYAAGRPA